MVAVAHDIRHGVPHFIRIGTNDLINPGAGVFQLNFSLFVIRQLITVSLALY